MSSADISFSIIIPVYNSASYLEQCLNSVLSQSYPNYEVIIIDDGSSDNSVNLIRSIIFDHSNCSLIQNAHAGVCVARNTGIKKAKGAYICFVDSDDIIFSDYLESLAEAAKLYNPDVIYFYAKYGVNNRPRKNYSGESYIHLDKKNMQFLASASICHTPEIDSPTSLYYGINSFSSWGQAFRTSIFKDHAVEFTSGVVLSEDGLLNLEMLYYAQNGIIIRKELYNYRTDNISATRSFKPNLQKSFERRNTEVKKLIHSLYKDDPIFIEHYYCGLIYQIKTICENYIFHPDNPLSHKEKAELFYALIDETDYQKAIIACENAYLPEANRMYWKYAFDRNPTKIEKQLFNNQRWKTIKHILKKTLKRMHVKTL